MAHFYSIDGVTPVVATTAWISDSATLIGNVIVEENCYVGPSASLRGDLGRIVLRAGSNVQDCCVLHSTAHHDTEVGACAIIGHGAVLHGCDIGANALVGINAVVLDGTKIGAQAIVGALSLVANGFALPPRTMAYGTPARVIRALTSEELGFLVKGAEDYRALGARMARIDHPLAP